MSIRSAEVSPAGPQPDAELHPTRSQTRPYESPYIVFPALLLLLIMPLGIVFHPQWLAFLAEAGTFIMFMVILRLMRL